MMLNGQRGQEMPESVAYAVLTACEGNLPISLREGHVTCARGYHAINAGCGVLSWGVLTGKCRSWRLTPRILELMLEGQQPKSLELFEHLKLRSAADWQKKCDQVGRVRRPWKRADPDSRLEITELDEMMPNLLFIHLCEWGQGRVDPAIGKGKLRKLAGESPNREIGV